MSALSDTELERSVLTTVLLANRVLPRLLVDEGLATDCFWNGEHQKIWVAMVALHDGGDPIDEHTLGARLSNRDYQLDEALAGCVVRSRRWGTWSLTLAGFVISLGGGRSAPRPESC